MAIARFLELSRLTGARYRVSNGTLMEVANLPGISDKDQDVRLFPFLLFPLLFFAFGFIRARLSPSSPVPIRLPSPKEILLPKAEGIFDNRGVSSTLPDRCRSTELLGKRRKRRNRRFEIPSAKLNTARLFVINNYRFGAYTFHRAIFKQSNVGNEKFGIHLNESEALDEIFVRKIAESSVGENLSMLLS